MIFRGKKHMVFTLVSQFVFFLVIGIMLLGFGGLTLVGQFGDFEKTTAVIEEINSLGEGDIQVIVSYTVDGTEYRRDLGYYSSDLMLGDEITIKYAPDDPENIRSTTVDYIGYVLVAAGVLMIFIGSRSLSKGLKRMKEDREQEKAFHAQNGDIPLTEQMFPADDEGALYYFHYDKNFSKQGHVMENKDRQVVYEGTIKAFKLVGDFEMDFINHISGHTETHFIGHTVTTETGNITTSSGFDYDGKNIWEHLRTRGVRIEPVISRNITKIEFEVTVEGRPFARFISSGANLYGEEKKGFGKLANLSAPGLFRIISFTDDLDLLFLIGVAITRSRS